MGRLDNKVAVITGGEKVCKMKAKEGIIAQIWVRSKKRTNLM